MINLRSILSILAMGSVVIDNPIPKGFVAKAIKAVALVVSSCLLLIALIMAGFFSLYNYLLVTGYTSLESSLVIAAGIGALTLVVVLFAINALTALMNSLSTDFKRNVPLPLHIANQTSGAIEAFVDGLMSRRNKQ